MAKFMPHWATVNARVVWHAHTGELRHGRITRVSATSAWMRVDGSAGETRFRLSDNGRLLKHPRHLYYEFLGAEVAHDA